LTEPNVASADCFSVTDPEANAFSRGAVDPPLAELPPDPLLRAATGGTSTASWVAKLRTFSSLSSRAAASAGA
jgi:hypothetical protein